jgi:hypothetical protein
MKLLCMHSQYSYTVIPFLLPFATKIAGDVLVTKHADVLLTKLAGCFSDPWMHARVKVVRYVGTVQLD